MYCFQLKSLNFYTAFLHYAFWRLSRLSSKSISLYISVPAHGLFSTSPTGIKTPHASIRALLDFPLQGSILEYHLALIIPLILLAILSGNLDPYVTLELLHMTHLPSP